MLLLAYAFNSKSRELVKNLFREYPNVDRLVPVARLLYNYNKNTRNIELNSINKVLVGKEKNNWMSISQFITLKSGEIFINASRYSDNNEYIYKKKAENITLFATSSRRISGFSVSNDEKFLVVSFIAFPDVPSQTHSELIMKNLVSGKTKRLNLIDTRYLKSFLSSCRFGN